MHRFFFCPFWDEMVSGDHFQPIVAFSSHVRWTWGRWLDLSLTNHPTLHPPIPVSEISHYHPSWRFRTSLFSHQWWWSTLRSWCYNRIKAHLHLDWSEIISQVSLLFFFFFLLKKQIVSWRWDWLDFLINSIGQNTRT